MCCVSLTHLRDHVVTLHHGKRQVNRRSDSTEFGMDSGTELFSCFTFYEFSLHQRIMEYVKRFDIPYS